MNIQIRKAIRLMGENPDLSIEDACKKARPVGSFWVPTYLKNNQLKPKHGITKNQQALQHMIAGVTRHFES